MPATKATAAPPRPALRKVKKQLVVDNVETQLRDAILSGAIPTGHTLAEAQLATQLGVSRASVRQAKFKLSQEGLLDFDSRGTASVRAFTDDDVRELIEFRQVLDVAAIRLASQRMTDEVEARLSKIIEQTLRAKKLLQLSQLDLAFHEEIVRAANNSRLLAAWEQLRPQLLLWLAGRHRVHNSTTARTQTQTVRSHGELLAALRDGDAERCEALARAHAAGLWSNLLAESDSESSPE
ncbi:GntR family transcriptional regulator [Aeoliella sp. SH292]|uniref:GntR family transcriptional regulator n=1 Tax=Aeoliella sp. SH292 TaxID=3454464 RepID=UPI003F9999C7